MKSFPVIVLVVLLSLPAHAFAGGWLIFDIAGDVQLVQGHTTTSLSSNKHLLTEVSSGDSITTKGNGRIVLVSMATNDAFEIGANAVVAIGEKDLKATKGSFKLQKGYALPKKQPKLMAGVVMRGEQSQECLQITRGTNTAVHTLTPTLKWQNSCDGNPVHVSLFADQGLVFEHEANAGELTLPQGTLQYGQRYVWLLETRKRDQIAAAAFKVIAAEEAAKVARLLDKPCCQSSDLASQLSDLFYLKEQGLAELAEDRQAMLSRAYPDADIAAALKR
jgi:hypothetical protein